MSNFEKPNSIPTEAIMTLYRATGMGVLDCRKMLEEASPLFYGRLMEAATTQGKSIWNDRRPFLHDPIEDDPQFAEHLQFAQEMAQAELEPEYARCPSWSQLGRCHSFWRTQKRILKNKYGIEWFSPSEMNPQIIFD